MQWDYMALVGKRKDFAKFENIHIEKANVYISGEEKRTFVKF